jgi:hypothetical protein
MARARNIKPSLFKNEILGTADPLYTILFEGLWVLADREGRLENRPLRIKAEIFPYREGLDIVAMLGWLEAKSFIASYKIKGEPFIQILKFVKHQNPHKNEAPSAIASMDEADPIKSEEVPIKSEALALIPDSLNLIPDSLNIDSGVSANDRQADPPPTEKAKVVKIPKARNLTAHDLITDLPGLSIGVAQDWILHRKNKKSPLTDSPWKSMLTQIGLVMAEFSLTADQVLAETMEAGWQTVKLTWMRKRLGERGNQDGSHQRTSGKADINWEDTSWADSLADGAY